MRIEQLESRTLLASTPWGEVLFADTVDQVEEFGNGDLLVMKDVLPPGGGAPTGTITRLSADGTIIWQRHSDFQLGEASVATSGGTDVVWISGWKGGQDSLLRVLPDGHIQEFDNPGTTPIAALSDGRVAFLSSRNDPQLTFMQADGDVESFSADLSGFNAVDLEADAEDNLYVTGYTSDPGGLSDGIIRKYDPSGTLLWQRRYDVGKSDYFYSVDIDPAGNAWVAAKLVPLGQTVANPSGDLVDGPGYIRAIRYSPDGSFVATPNVFEAVSFRHVSAPRSISATEGRAVISFDLNNDPTGVAVGVSLDSILWKSTVHHMPRNIATYATDGKLLVIQYQSGDTSVLLRVNEYREGSTLFVPGSTTDDLITVEQKGDRIVAHRGGDRIITYAAGLTEINVRLMDGNDSFTAPLPFNVTARGGTGNDTIITGQGQDTLYGGDGNDYIESRGSADTLSGGRGGDTILGGAGNDTVYGDGGMDLLYGQGGDDLLFGYFNDSADAGTAAALYGGPGNDELLADAENSTVRGGAGNDRINIPVSGAVAYGGLDQDTLSTGLGSLFGGPDADLFVVTTESSIKDLESIDSWNFVPVE